MRASHLGSTVEIGDRAGELQNPVKSARRKMQPVRGFPDQSEAAGIRLRNRLDDISGRSGIGQDSWKTKSGIACNLNFPRGGDAFGDLSRPLGGRRQHQIGSGDRRHIDMEVDAVEQGTRKPRLILSDAAGNGLPVTSKARLARVAATARVHRRDELKPRRIDDAVVGPRDRDFAGFERLPETIQNLRLELRQFVEE